MQTRVPSVSRGARAAATAETGSLGRLFLVAAIGHQAIETGVEQFIDGQGRKLLQCIL